MNLKSLRRSLLSSVLLGAAAMAGSASAQARTYRFAMAPEPLSQALRDYGAATHRQIIFAEALVRGRTAPALSGALTADEALAQLLAGTNLTTETTASGAIVLQRTPDRSGQAAASDPTVQNNVGEVVVTANKRPERLIDVAAAVTSLQGDALQERNLTRIADFAALTPGFSLQTTGTGGVRLILRGLNSGGFGATVSTLIDDASLTYTTANGSGNTDTADIDTYDLDHIEVLRGPQGTLYGSAAEGGLLKYVFNQPKLGRTEARFDAEGNTVDRGGDGYAFHGMVNVPLTQTLALRATGFYYGDAGYINDPLRGAKDDNDGKRYGGRVSLYWRPSDIFNLRVSALQEKQHYNATSQVEVNGAPATAPNAGGTTQFDLAHADDLQRNARIAEPFTRKYSLYDATANLLLPWVNVTSISSYGRNSDSFVTDYTDLPIAPTLTYGAYLGALVYHQPVAPFGLQSERLEKFTEELRVSSKPGLAIGAMPLEAQAGFYWTRERTDYAQGFSTSPLSALNTILTTPTVLGGTDTSGTYTEYSGFVDLTLHLTPKWQLSSGARFTSDDLASQLTTFQGILHPQAVPVVKNPNQDTSEDPITWSFSSRYSLTSHANVYARVASGYRPGGPNTPLPGVTALLPNYQSDSTVNYEAGFKGDVLDRRLSIDVAVFYIDWSNIQIISSVPTAAGPKNITGNAGSATSKGVEWNFTATPLHGLTITYSGAYTDAYLREDDLVLGAHKGDELPYVPMFSSSLSADYNFPISARMNGFVGATFSYMGNRTGPFTASPTVADEPRIPSYETVEVIGGVDAGRYRVEAYVQNLTNSRGITNYTSTSGYLGTGLADIIRPRTAGIRVGFRY